MQNGGILVGEKDSAKSGRSLGENALILRVRCSTKLIFLLLIKDQSPRSSRIQILTRDTP